MYKHILFIAIATILMPSAFAASKITPAAKPVDARGVVEVSNVRGEVKVVGWERNMVAVTGSLGADMRLVFESSGNRVVVRAERLTEAKGWLGWSGGGPSEDTILQLHVPATVSLEMDVVSADVRVSGIKSSERIKLDSVSGDADLRAETVRLDINSVSGDIDFSGRAELVRSESVSGDISLRGIDGDLSVDTVSGDAQVVASRIRQLDAGSVSGDIELDVELIGNANVNIESMSGDVVLSLPASLSATVNAETFSGSLDADFPVKIIDEKGPGSEMRGKLGNGDARIDLESFSGDISLRKR